MKKEEFNIEPIYYWKNCLSLRIRDVAHLSDSEYCDECGSTDIGVTDITTWDKLYTEKYKHSFLN